MADAHQDRLRIRAGTQPDFAERAARRRARRSRAATARFDPGAAHLESAVGRLGDGAHRGEPIDAHVQVDLVSRGVPANSKVATSGEGLLSTNTRTRLIRAPGRPRSAA